MLTSLSGNTRGALRAASYPYQIGANCKPASARGLGSTGTWREASLNWLSLGLLLAAWNASDDDPATLVHRRPDSLRGYSYVSVRAASRYAEEPRVVSMHRGAG